MTEKSAHTSRTQQPGQRQCQRDFSCLNQLYLAGTKMSSSSISQTRGRDEQRMLLNVSPGGASSFLPHLDVFSRDPNSHSASVPWGLPSVVLTSLCILL